ncbi:hypothetical protein B0T25DRAFT_87422 [Lasiosphaeria hispida]|uniref:Uncharacterized protein n=1 Tax=Lasiosphaeria hispida TaxID=260671 RepID=A0AAJ0HPN6_9PEZI|nr:hypothetical protein B0T25DRAFT_87422 [Lasiosphaeria hispida]
MRETGELISAVIFQTASQICMVFVFFLFLAQAFGRENPTPGRQLHRLKRINKPEIARKLVLILMTFLEAGIPGVPRHRHRHTMAGSSSTGLSHAQAQAQDPQSTSFAVSGTLHLLAVSRIQANLDVQIWRT